MITQREYAKHPQSFWLGKRVRALTDIATKGGMVMAAGAEGVIARKFGGFEVRVTECPHCHLAFFVRNANPTDLMLIEEN